MRPDILTSGGKYFDLLNPTREMFDIREIAHALSNVCRFSGHTRKFYSVAQHSCMVSKLCSKEHALAGLLHDCAEAYIGDVATPLKQLLPDYKRIEKNIEYAMFDAFGIKYPLHPEVKHFDLVMLATEAHHLMPHHNDIWEMIENVTPLSVEMVDPWGHAYAEREFLSMFMSLTK